MTTMTNVSPKAAPVLTFSLWRLGLKTMDKDPGLLVMVSKVRSYL